MPLLTRLKIRNLKKNESAIRCVFVVYIVLTVSTLIVLRTIFNELDFLGVGWIIILAALPLLPAIVPRFGEFIKMVYPYIQNFKIGNVQVNLREVRDDPITVPTTGVLVSLPDDFSALSNGTTISLIISSLRKLLHEGRAPVGTIDIRSGQQWRLPNLYFFSRLLEIEPVVSELLFTEVRNDIDGYLIATCRPDELRRQVEQMVPIYSSASSEIAFPVANINDPNQVQAIGLIFQRFLGSLGPPGNDTVYGFVTPRRVMDLIGPLDSTAIESPEDPLSESTLRRVIESPYRYVPTTSTGRLTGLIDRDSVALTMARSTLRQI
jgi:hypothetical protein